MLTGSVEVYAQDGEVPISAFQRYGEYVHIQIYDPVYHKSPLLAILGECINMW